MGKKLQQQAVVVMVSVLLLGGCVSLPQAQRPGTPPGPVARRMRADPGRAVRVVVLSQAGQIADPAPGTGQPWPVAGLPGMPGCFAPSSPVYVATLAAGAERRADNPAMRPAAPPQDLPPADSVSPAGGGSPLAGPVVAPSSAAGVRIERPPNGRAETAAAKPPAPAVGGPMQLAALSEDHPLGDRALGAVRGGFDLFPGVFLNFGFEQSTYVDNTLVQKIVVPTVMISPDEHGRDGVSVTTSVASPPTPSQPVSPTTASSSGASTVPPGVVTVLPNTGTGTLAGATVQVNASLGQTSVTSNFSGGGISTVISNQANGAIVRQMSEMNISITGLSQLIAHGATASMIDRFAGGSGFQMR